MMTDILTTLPHLSLLFVHYGFAALSAVRIWRNDIPGCERALTLTVVLRILIELNEVKP